jgi:hypothetical protein
MIRPSGKRCVAAHLQAHGVQRDPSGSGHYLPGRRAAEDFGDGRVQRRDSLLFRVPVV